MVNTSALISKTKYINEERETCVFTWENIRRGEPKTPSIVIRH